MTAESHENCKACPTINELDSENEIIIEPGDFKITTESTDPHYEPSENIETMETEIANDEKLAWGASYTQEILCLAPPIGLLSEDGLGGRTACRKLE